MLGPGLRRGAKRGDPDPRRLHARGRRPGVRQAVLLLAGWIIWRSTCSSGAWKPSILLPCLFATMMIGPLGLCLYPGVAA
ncbi:MAG: hypothetical protein ACXWUQ_08800 [Allosphingosinicella sp.]